MLDSFGSDFLGNLMLRNINIHHSFSRSAQVLVDHSRGESNTLSSDKHLLIIITFSVCYVRGNDDNELPD